MMSSKVFTLFTVLVFATVLCSCTKELVYNPVVEINNENSEKVEISVTLKRAGELKDVIGDVDYHNIAKLSVRGPINGTDLKYIRRIAGADEYGNETNGALETLDLSNASFVEGGDPYFIYVNKEDESETPIIQQENELSRFAFGYCKMKNLILPDSIQKFSSQAFIECRNLETINMPESLQEIGRSAFAYCANLMSEIIIPQGTTIVRDYTFLECSNLTSIILPESVRSLGYASFSGCLKITSLGELPNLEEFEEHCFENCRKLETFKIPSTMTSIPNYAFSGCQALNDIDVSNIVSIGHYAFHKCKKLVSLNLCDKLEYIGSYAFYNAGLSMDLILPQSVRYIGYRAFAGTDITSVEINSDIRTYETNDAFDILHSNPASFYSCDKLKTVKVAEGCRILGLSFFCCSALENVYLPNSLDSLGYYAIPPKLTYDDGEVQFYDVSLDIGHIFGSCTSLRNIAIPENLKFIAGFCFNNCSNLTNIILPDSVTSLGSYTFSGCSSLSYVKLSESLESISQGCFADCASLKSISLPSCCKEIDYECFKNSGLESIEFPESMITIGHDSFYGCDGLRNIVIPKNIKKIEDNAFSYCNALTSVGFDSQGDLETIGTSAFYHCTSLKNIQLPEGITSVGPYCFSLCGIQEVSIPSSLQNIGESCFERCQRLSHIRNFSENPQPIKSNTFGEVQSEYVTLYVPSTSINLYKADPLWGTFANIVGL